jgi:Fe2+ or Zn2+ uptake regulation protein
LNETIVGEAMRFCETCEKSVVGELSIDPIEGDAIVCEECGEVLDIPVRLPDYDAILKEDELDYE